jgi:NitT/TauT family transport system substrate-binding protein
MLARKEALALMAAGLTAAVWAPATAQTPGMKVRVGTSPSDPFLQPYYAQDMGYFTSNGLNAEIMLTSNGATTMAAVLGGACDIGNNDLIQLANAYNRGVDIGVIASGALYNADKPTISLVVNKNSAVKTAKDLEGSTIAVPNLKSAGGIAIQEWIARTGGDLTKVKFFEMTFAEMGPALVAGRIGAALSGEPFLTDAKNDIRRIVNPYDYIARSFYTGVWFGKRSWLNANLPIAKAMTTAIYDSGKWANAHQSDSAVIAARVNKLDVSKVRSFVRNSFAGNWDVKYAQPLLDLAFKYKLIEKQTQASDLYWTPGNA